jgi:membrane fusion protein (multidrug efflux system)
LEGEEGKTMKQRTKLIVIIASVFLMAWWIWHKSSQKTTEATEPKLVKVQKVTIAAAPEKIKATQDIQLSTEMSGYVTKINFNDGQNVKAGDLLFQLDNAKEQAAVTSAQADVNFSQNKLGRMQKLLSSHYVSNEDIDTAQDDLNAKISALKSAQDNLDKKAITAPFNGTVGAHAVALGDFINPGQKLVELVDRSVLKVDYSVPEKYFATVKLNQPVTVTSAEIADKTFNGTVTYISPSIDPDSHTLSLQASIPNSENILAPGLFVQVEQVLQQNAHAIVVPEESLVKSPDKTIVFRIINNKAVETPVKTGNSENGQVEIIAGLTANDVIVTAGQQKLDDGDAVKVVGN